MLKSWEAQLIDKLEQKNKRIRTLEEELDITKDDYNSLKIMYNELLSKATTDKKEASELMLMYKVLLQKLIRMCIESMNENGWYDTSIYRMCKTLKTKDEEYSYMCEEFEEVLNSELDDPLPDDNEESDEWYIQTMKR